MKINFIAAPTKSDKLKEMYKNLINHLRKDGHTVLDHRPHELDPEILVTQTDEEIADHYKKLEKYMKNCDVLIADISLPDIGTGYEISQAISLRKPVLALNFEYSDFHPIARIKGNKNKYLQYREYNEESLETTVKGFIEDAKDKLDTKFILIISSEIDKYLEWASKNKRMHKAQTVRIAVEKMMAKDKDYIKFKKTGN